MLELVASKIEREMHRPIDDLKTVGIKALDHVLQGNILDLPYVLATLRFLVKYSVHISLDSFFVSDSISREGDFEGLSTLRCRFAVDDRGCSGAL